MKKVRLTALVLAACMVLGACSLVELNEEKDRAQVIAKINGENILKGAFLDMVDEQVYYHQQMMQYGLSGALDDAALDSILELTWESLIDSAVQQQQAEGLSLTLSAEEEAAALQALTDELELMREDSQLQAEEEAAADSTVDTAARAEEIYNQFQIDYADNIASYRQYLIDEAVVAKLREHVTKDVQVSEEEAKAWYDEKLTSDTESVTNSDTYYEGTSPEAPILYVPDGYRRVKHILLIPEGDVTADVTAKETEQQEWADEMSELILADEEGNADRISELRDLVNQSKREVEDLNKGWYDTVRSEAAGLVQRLRGGEDFDKLMEEYGEDPGMQSEPGKTQGYLVGPNTVRWQEAFTAASNALKNIGDISEPVETPNGLHIIKLVSFETPGAVAYEIVKDAAFASVRTTKADELYTQTLQEWVDAATVRRYENRIEDVKDRYLSTSAPAA